MKSKNVDKARELVEQSRDDFSDFIYELINKSFDAGREAEANRNKTGSTNGYKEMLWNIHMKEGTEALNKASNLVQTVESLEKELKK